MVELSVAPERPQRSLSSAPYHIWTFPDGTDWTHFYRIPNGFLVRFPDLADYEISSDGGRVLCVPAPGVDAATTEHLYLNQVLPLAIGQGGGHVFHASAVDIGVGAVAFLAESGRGKSTLAASFAVRGHRFLTDDGLILESREDGILALPSHPSIRLWEDSHQVLLGAGAERAPAVAYTDKGRFMAGNRLTHCDVPRPLLAAYFLGSGEATATRFHPLPPSEAVIEWTGHSFLLDIENSKSIGDQFEAVAGVVNRVPAFRLDYPRCYDYIPQLLAAIIAHASAGGPNP